MKFMGMQLESVTKESIQEYDRRFLDIMETLSQKYAGYVFCVESPIEEIKLPDFVFINMDNEAEYTLLCGELAGEVYYAYMDIQHHSWDGVSTLRDCKYFKDNIEKCKLFVSSGAFLRRVL